MFEQRQDRGLGVQRRIAQIALGRRHRDAIGRSGRAVDIEADGLAHRDDPADQSGQTQGPTAQLAAGVEPGLDPRREGVGVGQARGLGEQPLDPGVEFISRHDATFRLVPPRSEAGHGVYPDHV